MTLIRLGQLYVNLDRVTSILDLSCDDGGGQVAPGPLRICFDEGRPIDVVDRADALRAWLQGQATPVGPG